MAFYNSCLSQARVQAHWLAGIKPYGTGDFYKQAILTAMLRGTDFTHIATAYVALYSAQPGDADASGTEISASGYARASITNNTSNWAALAQDAANLPYYTKNNNTVSEGTAGANWGWVGWFSLEDAASSSHRIMWGQLAAPQNVLNGQNVFFSANQLTVKEA